MSYVDNTIIQWLIGYAVIIMSGIAIHSFQIRQLCKSIDELHNHVFHGKGDNIG